MFRKVSGILAGAQLQHKRHVFEKGKTQRLAVRYAQTSSGDSFLEILAGDY